MILFAWRSINDLIAFFAVRNGCRLHNLLFSLSFSPRPTQMQATAAVTVVVVVAVEDVVVTVDVEDEEVAVEVVVVDETVAVAKVVAEAEVVAGEVQGPSTSRTKMPFRLWRENDMGAKLLPL
jgi:hypothetical protein